MDATVLICTYNRCESLKATLHSALAQSVPASLEWEVLVVDNNSSDATKDVVHQFTHAHGDRVRYLFEGRQGKSNALNTGIREARGKVIAFLDDDAVADSSWLATLTEPLLAGSCDGTGGRILLPPSIHLPAWIPHPRHRWTAPLALFDLGAETIALSEAPYGTNMAFSKSLFDLFGGFRTDLGPQAGSEIRNEDTEFGSRLLKNGKSLTYVPQAVVYHYIPQARLTRQYFEQWFHDKGRADIRENNTYRDASWFIGDVPVRLLIRLMRYQFTASIAIQPAARMRSYLTAVYLRGQMRELSAIRRSGRVEPFA